MKIRVNLRGEAVEISSPVGARLLDYLQENAVPVNAACGGNGTCHKCRIRVTDGFLAITPKDREAFRESELASGWRLSCQSRPKTNVNLEVPAAETLRNRPRITQHNDLPEFESGREACRPGLVCDLGSTGVVVAIVDESAVSNGSQSLVEAHLLNRQVRFGADVMTRLHQAQLKGIEPLRDSLLETLKICLDAVRVAAPNLFAKAFPGGMVCSGNSAMTSFLLNRSTEKLAVAPFQPDSREAGEFVAEKLDGLKVSTLPLLAGFVGGDTVAGILAVEALRAEEPWVLIDIGTNTEIVVNNGRGELWLSSAPAGPAFEGGNINQGMRAESGAISVARYNSGWSVETTAKPCTRQVPGHDW